METSNRSDIARAVGVSPMTVSRVVNGNRYVAAETRRKVLAACKTLGYRKNLSAAVLRGQPSQAIGVIVSTFRHMYYARFLEGVEEATRRSKYHIVVLQEERGADPKTRLEWSDCEFLLSRQIDGLIINAPITEAVVKRLKAARIPVVFISEPEVEHGFSFVSTAEFDGAKVLTSYLISKGHRHIAFLAGAHDSYSSQERQKGYLAALADAQIEADPLLQEVTNWGLDGGYEAARRLLERVGPGALTAIFGANDYVAIGAMRALWEQGIRVPEQVSVVGFTGDEIGAYTCPPLTTMLQPIKEIGERAVDLLLSQVRDETRIAERVLLEAALVERDSVAPVAKSS